MTWRYELASRLAFLMLIISVVMMILLPFPRRSHRSEQDNPKQEKES